MVRPQYPWRRLQASERITMVGVVLDSGVVFAGHWAPHRIIPPAGTSITLTPGLTGSASAKAAIPSLSIRTKIERPLRVVSGRSFAFNGQIDTQMIMMSRIDYRNQPEPDETPGTIT